MPTSLTAFLALGLPPRPVLAPRPVMRRTVTGRIRRRPMSPHRLLFPQTRKNPDEKGVLQGVDYETLELQALASGDPHAEMAARIFQGAAEGDLKARRLSAQSIGFAALYGGRGLAKALKFGGP